MYIYLPMIILTLFFTAGQRSVKKKWEKKFIFILMVLPGTLVAAFRYNNGADYFMYYSMFQAIKNGNTFINVTGKTLELGFKYLIIVSQWFCDEPWFTFGTIALIIIILIFKGCLEISDDYRLSIMLFFVSGIYFDSFNGLRQFLAMAVFFYGIKYILNKDIKKYFVCCILAFLFHKSVLFISPLYFLQYVKIDIKKACIIIVSSFIGGSIIYNLILRILKFTPYAYFLNSNELATATASASQILFFCVYFAIGFYYYVQMKQIECDTQLFFNIHVVFFAVALLTTTVPLISRILNYGILIEILYIPKMLNLIRSRNTKKIVRICIIGFYLVINLYGIYNNGWYGCIPYNFYF